MAETKLSGHSDDLIELDGALSEEFQDRGQDEGDLVAFSDGTILRITFGDGWRITPVRVGAGFKGIVQHPEGDEDNYSDVATIEGAIWAVHGINYVVS